MHNKVPPISVPADDVLESMKPDMSRIPESEVKVRKRHVKRVCKGDGEAKLAYESSGSSSSSSDSDSDRSSTSSS